MISVSSISVILVPNVVNRFALYEKNIKNPRYQNCSMLNCSLLKFVLLTIAIPLSYKNNGEGSKSDL